MSLGVTRWLWDLVDVCGDLVDVCGDLVGVRGGHLGDFGTSWMSVEVTWVALGHRGCLWRPRGCPWGPHGCPWGSPRWLWDLVDACGDLMGVRGGHLGDWDLMGIRGGQLCGLRTSWMSVKTSWHLFLPEVKPAGLWVRLTQLEAELVCLQ